jgi:hypothetical protein
MKVVTTIAVSRHVKGVVSVHDDACHTSTTLHSAHMLLSNHELFMMPDSSSAWRTVKSIVIMRTAARLPMTLRVEPCARLMAACGFPVIDMSSVDVRTHLPHTFQKVAMLCSIFQISFIEGLHFFCTSL